MVGPVFGHKNNPFKDGHPSEEDLGTAKKRAPDSHNDLNKPTTVYKDIDAEIRGHTLLFNPILLRISKSWCGEFRHFAWFTEFSPRRRSGLEYGSLRIRAHSCVPRRYPRKPSIRQ